MYMASKALTYWLHAVTAVTHNAVAPLIIVFIGTVNTFLSQQFSAIKTYITIVVHALNECDPDMRRHLYIYVLVCT
jgi:hypothetical protein